MTVILDDFGVPGDLWDAWKIHGIPDVVPVVFDGEINPFQRQDGLSSMYLFTYIYNYIYMYLFICIMYIYIYVFLMETTKKRGCHSHIQLIWGIHVNKFYYICIHGYIQKL